VGIAHHHYTFPIVYSVLIGGQCPPYLAVGQGEWTRGAIVGVMINVITDAKAVGATQIAGIVESIG